jgi:hypothetical protein
VQLLWKLELPLVKISQFLLFGVSVMVLLSSPLLSTLRELDRQSQSKKELEDEQQDDDYEVPDESEMIPANSISEFYARIMLLIAFFYLVSEFTCLNHFATNAK